METLQLLAAALGLAGLAGINLYLTVFVTGLAVNQHWIVLAPQYQQLEVLGHPAIIIIAGSLYLLEFFADKVPWVDSLWDSVHTVIRPIGAAFLAIQVLGEPQPVYGVIVALLAGGTALVTHGIKASTRLVINSSPEPFSNIAVSLGEDVGVVGGLMLMSVSPFLTLGALAVLLAAAAYFLPQLFRMARVQLWLISRKLQAPASNGEEVESLPADLPPDIDILFSHHTVLSEKPSWAVRCVSAGARGIPGHVFGYLVATEEEPQKLHFLAKRRFGAVTRTIDLEGYRVAREPKFLSENLVLYRPDRKRSKCVFVFDRTARSRVEELVTRIRERLEQPLPGLKEEPAEPVEPAEIAGA